MNYGVNRKTSSPRLCIDERVSNKKSYTVSELKMVSCTPGEPIGQSAGNLSIIFQCEELVPDIPVIKKRE